MANADNELVLTWLNDAHSIENALVHTLEKHSKEAKNYPEIAAKINEHLAQTRRHEELVAARITALGGQPSTHKDRLAGLIAPVENLLTGPGDEESVLKNSFSDYASENFEIATYQTIITAAQDTGDADTAQVCRRILADEQEMALWLDEHLPALVAQIVRQATPAQG